MGTDLSHLEADVLGRLQVMRRALAATSEGKGSHFISFIALRLTDVEQELASILAEVSDAAGDEDILRHLPVKILRLIPRLEMLHVTVAQYAPMVGRRDMSVGFVHLLDVLMEEILINRSDPVVRLDTQRMYSTINITRQVDYLMDHSGSQLTPYVGDDSIAFNLPALDPENALLSPVLAHEATHSAVNQKLLADLLTSVDPAIIDAIWLRWLTVAGLLPNQKEANAWGERLKRWCAELLCDIVAIALTGPAFVFSFIAFVPTMRDASLGNHPYHADRIQFQLDALESLGWTSVLEARTPGLLSWMRDSAENHVLDGTPEESFLREVLDLARETIRATAINHIPQARRLDPTFAVAGLDDAMNLLADGIPAVEAAGGTLTPWEILLSAWLVAIAEGGDQPRTLKVAPTNEEFGRLVVKSIELAGIKVWWERS